MLSLLAVAACSRSNDKKGGPQQIPVVIANAIIGTVPITLSANGTVEPLETVALRARVSGPVVAVRFHEGDEVRVGDVLFEIDPSPYRIALDQARAVLERDRASAAAAKSDADRYASLVNKGYVTQSQAQQQLASSQALAATVAADEAAVRAAELNLQYTSVRAPISGRTGNLNVRVGNQVNGPTGEPLVVINAVTPVHVRFPVTDRELATVRAAQQSRRGLVVTVRDSTTNGVTERGRVDFIDNSVDSVSGTVMLKALFDNKDRGLWPGSFVPVTLVVGEIANAVLVPAVAVQQGPTGAYVFSPDASGKARQLPVKVSRTTGDIAVIASGITAGQRVVTDGQSRLFAGAAVSVTRTVAFAAPSAAASPIESGEHGRQLDSPPVTPVRGVPAVDSHPAAAPPLKE